MAGQKRVSVYERVETLWIRSFVSGLSHVNRTRACGGYRTRRRAFILIYLTNRGFIYLLPFQNCCFPTLFNFPFPLQLFPLSRFKTRKMKLSQTRNARFEPISDMLSRNGLFQTYKKYKCRGNPISLALFFYSNMITLFIEI